MTEQRLKVESGPPEHMFSGGDAVAAPSPDDGAPAERAKGAAQEVAGKAKEQERELAGKAKQQAQAAAEQVKETAAAKVDEGSTKLGQQVGTQAQSLDGVAEELRRQGKDGPAKIAAQAGQKVKDVGDYLQQTDGESLLRSAKDAARENPAAAAAAGGVAGFVAGRVIKAATGDSSAEDGETGRPGEGGS